MINKNNISDLSRSSHLDPNMGSDHSPSFDLVLTLSPSLRYPQLKSSDYFQDTDVYWYTKIVASRIMIELLAISLRAIRREPTSKPSPSPSCQSPVRGRVLESSVQEAREKKHAFPTSSASSWPCRLSTGVDAWTIFISSLFFLDPSGSHARTSPTSLLRHNSTRRLRL